MKLKDLLTKLNDIKHYLGDEVEICTVGWDEDNEFCPIKDVQVVVAKFHCKGFYLSSAFIHSLCQSEMKEKIDINIGIIK